MSVALSNYIVPLNDYISKFSVYNDFIGLDEESYVSQFVQQNPDAAAIKTKIEYHMNLKNVVLSSIPKSMWLGFFTVKLDEVARKLSEKHENIAKRFLDFFNTLLRTSCSEISGEFSKIMTQLKVRPKSIDVLVEMSEFVQGVPASLSSLQVFLGFKIIFYCSLKLIAR